MAMRLLVIDDSLTIRKSIELALRAETYTIEFGTSGQEGLNKAFANPPDVILLDFVLPDMKGTDVVRQLATKPRTQTSPVIVMSAKHEKVRELFVEWPQVIDFMAKPFTRTELTTRIESAAEVRKTLVAAAPVPTTPPSAPTVPVVPSTTPTVTPGTATFSYTDKEEAAKAIFGQLKPQLAQIPTWMPGLGSNQPGLYFARKILLPSLIGQMLESLRPMFQRVLGGSGPAYASLQGTVAGWPLFDILKTVGQSHHTGELTLSFGNSRVQAWVRRGDFVLVSSRDPVEVLTDSEVELSAVPAEAREKAEAEMRASGKSVFLSLAEGGHLPEAELPQVLQRAGRRLLGLAMAAPSVRFEWREGVPSLAAEAHGRVIPLQQLLLDRLRQASSSRDVENAVPSLDTVFTRTVHFSQKVRVLDLTSAERRVLAIVDGRNPVKALAERTGLPPQEVVHVVHRLAEVDLIRKSVVTNPRAVMIVDQDLEGVRKPLAHALSVRAQPLELVSLEGEQELSVAVRKERPSMVIVNATQAGARAERLAQQVSGGSELGEIVLVALLDTPNAGRSGELLAAGYDAVLSKPVHFKDLEPLLSSRG
jgi:DNA-binding response OmpR family regulator/DNA-binding Lrp family transcriptional regulator